MAARLDPRSDERTRGKIQTTQLVKRLNAFALSEADPQTGKPVEMSASQVKAATTLLDRVMPRLQTVDGGLTLTHVNHEDALSQLEAAADEPAADDTTPEVNGHSH